MKDIFDLLDLGYEGLEKVKYFADKKLYDEALEELNNYFLSRKNDSTYINPYDLSKIKEYCSINFPREVEEIIDVSEQVKNKTFLFRFKWDMERTNVPFTFEGDIVWDKVPFDDGEWVFMLNRHRYWVALGQAYTITENEDYAKTFCEQLEHWIDNNPNTDENKKTTWRTIEAGVRCENWIKSYEYFRGNRYFSKEVLVKFIKSLYEHGEYIYNSYDNFRKLSNWGVLENHGLFILSVFLPELKASKLWREDSIKRLEEEINLQVMRDGFHWEQSPMYHNEVLHCYLDTINLAEKKEIKISEIIKTKTRDLAFANLYMMKPNYHQPMQSDSDDTDLRDMITKAATIFKDGQLKYMGYNKLDFHSVWDLGIDAIKVYDELIKKEPEYLSFPFNDSGNYYMRTSWNKESKYLHFRCGSLGSGHGHADLLHFDLFAEGQDLLIDPGRYTYVEGNPWRLYFKGCSAHNTTMVDEKDFTIFKDSWSIQKAAMSVKGNFMTYEDYDYVEGGHLGYMGLESPVYVGRKIIFIKPYYWVLVDEFYGKGKHKYNQLFHFSQGIIESHSIDKIVFQKNNVKLNIFQLNNKDIHYGIEKGFVSPEYNKMYSAPILNYTLEKENFASFITVLYPQKVNQEGEIICEKVPVYKGTGELIDSDEAEAIKIKINSKENHIILVAHGERARGKKLYVVEGVPIYGKVVFIKKVNGQVKTQVIKY